MKPLSPQQTALLRALARVRDDWWRPIVRSQLPTARALERRGLAEVSAVTPCGAYVRLSPGARVVRDAARTPEPPHTAAGDTR